MTKTDVLNSLSPVVKKMKDGGCVTICNAPQHGVIFSGKWCYFSGENSICRTYVNDGLPVNGSIVCEQDDSFFVQNKVDCKNSCFFNRYTDVLLFISTGKILDIIEEVGKKRRGKVIFSCNNVDKTIGLSVYQKTDKVFSTTLPLILSKEYCNIKFRTFICSVSIQDLYSVLKHGIRTPVFMLKLNSKFHNYIIIKEPDEISHRRDWVVFDRKNISKV